PQRCIIGPNLRVGLGRVLANVNRAEVFVRCVGCEMDPLSPARYCECCGREISPNRNESGEPHRAAAQPETVEADTRLYDWAPKRSAWDLRCPNCGGPSLDAGRCQACQKAADPIEPAGQPGHAN